MPYADTPDSATWLMQVSLRGLTGSPSHRHHQVFIAFKGVLIIALDNVFTIANDRKELWQWQSPSNDKPT